MAVEIIPSVLAHQSRQLTTRLTLARALSPSIHLDIMDGNFVRARSVGLPTIRRLNPRSAIELHLMTARPARWLPIVLKLKIRRVIVHVELGRNLKNVIALYRAHSRSVILAINPRTSISKLKPWIKSVQGILVLGVHPGKYHGRWQSATPGRIKRLCRLYPTIPVACDGGLSPDTIPQAIRAGAKRLIVGSYVQYHQHPKQAWRELRQLAAQTNK